MLSFPSSPLVEIRLFGEPPAATVLKLADDMSVKGKRLYVRDMFRAAGQCED